MKNKIIFTGLFFLICLGAQAQKEAYNWYFGKNAGLTWNTTRSWSALRLMETPTALPGDDAVTGGRVTLYNLPTQINVSTVKIDNYEGCFAISDAAGNPKFYSDGEKVWDGNGVLKSSGLGGHPDAAQSGILMPYPRDPSKYVAISIGSGAAANTSGLRYTVLDNDGNIWDGKVGIKLPGIGNASEHLLNESITAILTPDKKGFWILAIAKGKSEIWAWKFTKDSGGNPVISDPVKSALPETTQLNASGNGYLKFSPDGKYFTWAEGGTGGRYFIGTFDKIIGKAENIKTYQISGVSSYGIEYSKNGKYLYASTNQGFIYMFNFADMITKTQTQLNTYLPLKRFKLTSNADIDTHTASAMQTSPAANRIYVAMSNLNPGKGGTHVSALYLIDDTEYGDPKIYALNGTAENKYFLGSPGSNPSSVGNPGGAAGLPSFSPSWFAIDIDGETDVCVGTPSDYSLTIMGSNEQLSTLHHTVWDFGDGTVMPNNTNVSLGSVQEYTHTYTTPGTYTITVTAYNSSNGVLPDLGQTFEVTVNALPVITKTYDVDICAGSGGTIVLKADVTGADNVLWYTTSTGGTPLSQQGASVTIPAPSVTTSYYAEAVNSTTGCLASSRMELKVSIVNAPTTLDISAPTTVCVGDNIILQGTTDAGTIDWYESGIKIGSATTYSVTTSVVGTRTFEARATNGSCSLTQTKTATVDVVPAPTITVETKNLKACPGDQVQLSGTTSAPTIDWYSKPLGESGSTLLTSGNPVSIIPPSSGTTTYYGFARGNACYSTGYVTINVTIEEPVTFTVSPSATICSGYKYTLTATPADGISVIDWYDAPIGDNVVHSGNSVDINPTETVSYYGQIRNSPCTTPVRKEVKITVEPCNGLPVNPHLRSFYKNK